MMPIALAACLLCQTHDDFAFVRAVEAFVIETVPAPRLLGDHLPPDVYAEIMVLGDPCPRCRTAATESLRAMGPDVVRWLFWGVRKRDAECRWRCIELIAYFTRCEACGGSGRCARYQPRPAEGPCRTCGMGEYPHLYCDTKLPCLSCAGTGGAIDPETP
jgi:hypothetical protein